MNIVFTGTAIVAGEHYDREKLTKLAQLYGHRVQKRVDWATDMLVDGDETHTTIKKSDALRLRKRIVKVEEFLDLLFLS
jgi:NAD-dependent DNA ligase